jgi:hypothetical protein
MNADKMMEASDALIDLLEEKVGELGETENMQAAIALLEIVKQSIITAAMQ